MTRSNCAAGRILNTNAPYGFHHQTSTHQHRPDNPQPFNVHGPPSGLANASQDRSEGGFDMGSMTGALPTYRSSMPNLGPSQTQQRFPLSTSPSALQQQQHQQISQMSGHGMGNTSFNTAFSSQYLPSYSPAPQGASASTQQYMQQQASHPTRSIIPSPIQQTYNNPSYFPNQQQSHQPYMFYPTSYGQANSPQVGFQGWSTAHSQSSARRLSQSFQQGPNRQLESPMNVMSGGFQTPGVFAAGGAVAYGYSTSGPYLRPGSAPGRMYTLT